MLKKSRKNLQITFFKYFRQSDVTTPDAQLRRTSCTSSARYYFASFKYMRSKINLKGAYNSSNLNTHRFLGSVYAC